MSSLVAVVPDAEVRRSEVVAVRVARKVAALFGVRWTGSPFDRTWVCDLAGLTLSEIGRGAPYPDKSERVQADEAGAAAESPWAFVGRGVWTPDRNTTPSMLPAATLNRFGPDTKAAVVLTAANRLLIDATEGVADVVRNLASQDLDPALRLAVWAGLVAEVYRAQPALVVAAIQARAVQRSLTSPWHGGLMAPLEPRLPPSARCEFPMPVAAIDGDVSATRPVNLDLIDSTLPLVDRQPDTRGASSTGPDTDRLDDVADAWCRRMLRFGRPGRGITWLVETEGHRQVEAYLRVGAVVTPFVAEVLQGAGPSAAGPLPQLPDAPALRGMALQSRRAHIVAAHVVVNALRYRDDLLQAGPSLRDDTRRFLEQATTLAADVLGPQDPATILITGYTRYIQVWDLLQATAPQDGELATAVDRLQVFQERLASPSATGQLDAGTLTYLLELGNVALSAAGQLLRAPDLARTLTRAWDVCLSLRGLSEHHVLTDPRQVPRAQAFHLQHFAAFHAARGGVRRLRQAYALQDWVSEVRDEVAQGEPAGYAAKHTASRHAHELAASIALSLADALPAREERARAIAAADALRHAVAVLDNPTTQPMLRSGEPPSAVLTTARSTIPAIVVGAERGGLPSGTAGDELRDQVLALLGAASAAANRNGAVDELRRLTDWAKRLGSVGWSAPSPRVPLARSPRKRRSS